MDVAPQLRSALGQAGQRLNEAASAAARAQTPLGRPVGDGAMVRLADSAIFSEALLGALHARLEELKSVTK